MLIVYSKANEQVLGWSYKEAEITENSIISDDLVMRGVDFTKVGYDFYKDKEIIRQYDEEGNELPIYLDDLDLEPMDAEGLPDSEHPAKLIAVNPALAKPATVRRWHGGIAYDVNCLVSQNIVDMWLANPKELNIGDWVLVSFLDELTATDEKHIAIVTDKIFESWG